MQRSAERPLSGQVALVTGGARGIGAAVCQALAQDGATVYAADLLPCDATVAAIAEDGALAHARKLDVADRQACVALADEVMAAEQRLDILVCNAGICPPGEVTGNWAQWDRVIDVNVNGTQACIAACWPHMMARGYGRIVLVSSMAYYQGGVIVGTEYSASKGAVAAMTRHVARNGGPHGILCNAVAPGVIATDMTASFSKPDPQAIPLRRVGTAEDVAGPVRFLCGPYSAYMTGTILNVTGGIVLAA
ncbi:MULTISPECIES: SDR family NAD(P)-dependent oxidoreductase [unclassified Chelatococcus]|uniref:SDR family NAD(P)-dependent oxidoreductase n=1 Tax=unclassified Chelatococcus TaxID=2638111 RepID=UPI001BD0E8FC|nr:MULTISPECIES: SDR family NAD(P)-dependent oxidoreductase [unclassified Chelatococcus]MBS7699779.1 SDR family oxidoreductase [Chelatococcus sp. YT9]MBX3558125.1 SDR family oxidoreductase [Chelatococcus sp.]